MPPWGQAKQLPPALIWDFRQTLVEPEHGMRVLVTLCEMMHFFDDEIVTEEQRILSNCAKKILCYCGIWQPAQGRALLEELYAARSLGRTQRLLSWLKGVAGRFVMPDHLLTPDQKKEKGPVEKAKELRNG